MNASALTRVAKRTGRQLKQIQNEAFGTAVVLFHCGNLVLPIAIIVIVYQASLWVGLVASSVVFAIALRVVTVNLVGLRRIKLLPQSGENSRRRIQTVNQQVSNAPRFLDEETSATHLEDPRTDNAVRSSTTPSGSDPSEPDNASGTANSSIAPHPDDDW